MTGITNDRLSLQCDNVKKIVLHLSHNSQFPSIGSESPHLNCLVKSPTYKITLQKIYQIYIRSYHFTLGHIFYMHTQYIFTQIFKELKFYGVNLGNLKIL